MAGSLGTLTVTLGVDAREFQSGLKDAQTSVGGFSDKVKNIGSTIAEGIKASQTTILQAVRALDKQLGTDLNSILSGAFLALDLAEPFGNVIKGAIAKVMGNTTVMAATAALGSFLGLIEMEARTLAAYGIGAIQKAVAALLAFQIPLAAAGTTVGTVTGTAIGVATALAIPAAIGAALLAGGALVTALNVGAAPLAWSVATTVTENIGDGIADHLADDVREGMVQSNLAVQFPKDMEAIAQKAADALAKKKIWDESAQSITGDLASALMDTSAIDEAMAKVEWAITHPMALAAQEANIEGAILRIQYAKGVAGTTKEQQTIFDQQIAALKAAWANIAGVGYDEGVHTAQRWYNGYVFTFQGNKVNLPGWHGNTGEPPPQHGIPHHAMGGYVPAGSPTWVGERGPELFVPNVNGTIIPNGSAGGTTYNFTINDATDPQRVAAVIESYVRSASRVRHQRWSTS